MNELENFDIFPGDSIMAVDSIIRKVKCKCAKYHVQIPCDNYSGVSECGTNLEDPREECQY